MSLKVGLEIHTQLLTRFKLFSLSSNTTSNLTHKPNTSTSFFDVSIPGTQPALNPQCILQAIKLSKVLNCKINAVSSFDRKHYFYGDQPLGYQITQHFKPISQNGCVTLLKRHYDKLTKDVKIGIQQLQLEQDTGRSIYKSTDVNKSLIDFNRAGIPLIEMVTDPDFTSVDEVRAFLQTYTKTVKDLGICSGDLETGAIRVDVNVSVDKHQRVEIKNLPTISAILNAIRFESKRQVNNIKNDNLLNEVETRGWNGKETYHLRSKESNIDYRYVPDMELPKLKLNVEDLLENVKLPKSYGDQLDQLMDTYHLNLRDAKILLNNEQLLNFFIICYKNINDEHKPKVINWLVHQLLGSLTKSELQFTSNTMRMEAFNKLIELSEQNKLTKPNAKLLLLHLVNNRDDQNKDLVELSKEFGLLSKEVSNDEVQSIIADVINNNKPVVDQILNGRSNKVNFLIGQCMRKSQGKIQPTVFEALIKSQLKLIKIKSID